MKPILSKILLTALICTLFTNSYAEDHSHSHSESDKTHNTEFKLNNGKKWATDLPLRQSMKKVSELMTNNISRIHNNKMSDSDYKNLSQKISVQTKNIFKNCKLSPKADEQLHKLLVPILKAEKVFLGTDKSLNKHDAAMAVMKSLDNYRKYFNHKG